MQRSIENVTPIVVNVRLRRPRVKRAVAPTIRIGAATLIPLGLGMAIGIRMASGGPHKAMAAAPPSVGARAQRLVNQPVVRPQAIPALPAMADELPKSNTAEFSRRIRRMGLDPVEVAQFRKMMKERQLTAFRR